MCTNPLQGLSDCRCSVKISRDLSPDESNLLLTESYLCTTQNTVFIQQTPWLSCFFFSSLLVEILLVGSPDSQYGTILA